MNAVSCSRDPALADPAVELTCPRCGSALSLHQPDADLPGRLLATCDGCKAWFLAAGSGGRLVSLPEVDDTWEDPS